MKKYFVFGRQNLLVIYHLQNHKENGYDILKTEC